MFGNLGGSEIFLILLIVLVFFGAKKLPELAKGLGQGIREFRKAARDVQEAVLSPWGDLMHQPGQEGLARTGAGFADQGFTS